jgi:hypothetical protein
MSAATLSIMSFRRLGFRTALAAAAVSAGRALQRWGRRRTAHQPTRERIAQERRIRLEAEQVWALNMQTMNRGGIPFF